jgi:hypothetical protein
VNILFVTHLPEGSRGGDADRVDGLVAGLRANGHAVDVHRLPIRKPLHARRWRPWWYVEPTGRWLAETAERAAASDLVVASLLPGAAAVARALAEHGKASRFVYDAHNDESRLAEQTMRSGATQRVRLMEASVFASVDAAWVAGDRDTVELGRRFSKASLTNVPNGIDSGLPDFSDVEVTPGAAFTYGTWSYQPNADGLAALAKAAVQQPGALRVFGTIDQRQARALEDAAAAAQPALSWEFRGFEPDWAAVAGSGATGIIPVWSGAGTKLRAVQLAGMGAPFVPTTEALSGLPSRFAELAPPIDDPGTLLERALEGRGPTPDGRRELRQLVLAELTWERLAAKGLAA